MDLSALIRDLAPEFILLIGACAVLLAGSGPLRGPGAKATGPLSVITVLAAFCVAWYAGTPEPGSPIPGIMLDPLVHYVRLGGLGIGLLLLLCNLHLPIAEERAEFFSMILLSLLGLLMTALANDLIVLFFAIELVSVPTYVLISLSREDRRASESAVKYFFLGALAAGFMVYGFSFLYGALGGHTTILAVDGGAALATVAAQSGATTFVVIGMLLALAGIFFKMAVVPFHVYAPDVYEGAASPVTGLLGFLPKFAAFVAAAKLLGIFRWDAVPLHTVFWLLWIVSALTMVVGNALALLQQNVKRILAYSSIAHSGYMLIGLLVGPAVVAGQGPMRDGIAAMLFYMVIYGAMNLGAFAVLSALHRQGEAVEQLDDLGGLSQRRPGLALAMAVCCFSLMGFPPTAGLLGKVYIFSSAFSVGDVHPFGRPLIALVIIGVLTSAVGAAYYLRIVAACYTRKETGETEPVGGMTLRWGVALCSLVVLLLFIRPGLITDQARRAAEAFRGTIAQAPAVAPPEALAATDGTPHPHAESHP